MIKLQQNARPKAIATLRLAVFALGLPAFLLTFSACVSERERKLDREVAELRTEVHLLRELKHDVTSLAGEVTLLKTPGSNDADRPDEQAVIPVVYRPEKSLRDDPFMGPKDAEVMVMAFSNFQCQPCRQFYTSSFAKLREEFLDNNKIKFVFRDFPLSSNAHSEAAAMLAHCAGEQGRYWEMCDLLFRNAEKVDEGKLIEIAAGIDDIQSERLQSCIDGKRYTEEIRADMDDAVKLGAKGAPGFFVGRRATNGSFNGVFIRGAQPYPFIRQEINKALTPNAEASNAAAITEKNLS